jgi:two-component system sensor histidine kinase UhpB
MALYRCAQEALNNIARHSGAGAATLSLRRADSTLSLIVSDDGRGNTAPRGGGVGLFSISERADSIGAALQIESPPGGGTRVTVTLPLDD